jgi:hypothetical protein
VRPLHAVALVALSSCLQLGAENTDGGARNALTSDAAGAAQSNTGTGCVDLGSGVQLCTSISLCPGVAVDHDAYPNCGFRMPGSIDLECICGNVLCPMGSAISCTQARDLLASQAEVVVCTQASEGRCAALTTQNPVQTCSPSCAAECVSDPLCLRLCGC